MRLDMTLQAIESEIDADRRTRGLTPHRGGDACERFQPAPGSGSLSIVTATAVALAMVLGLFGSAAAQTTIDPSAWIRHPGRGFSIGAAEVTVSQFRDCVRAGKCAEADLNGQCNYGREGRDAHPVNCVTFDGAEKFCAWTGGRLCTEDEWLAACRGTEERAFPYGPSFDAAACNVHSNTAAAAGEAFDTAPVGASAPCEGGLPGLFDMAGNVAEWVDDCKETYCKFRGAGYLSNDPVDHFSGCSGVCSGNQKSLKSNVVGIRCCRDASD
jgi:formylglycine-generating enzyme required for sulfatase activity